MGEVWRAYDTGTDRIVAIKLLPPHFSDNEEFKQRFRREAQAAAKLNTPHVIPIHVGLVQNVQRDRVHAEHPPAPPAVVGRVVVLARDDAGIDTRDVERGGHFR
jgi:hypothetical protein